MKSWKDSTFFKWLISLLILSNLPSCLQPRTSAQRRASGGISNDPSSVTSNYGRYLTDNPIILSNNPSLGADADLSLYLSEDQKFITSNQFLIGPCAAQSSLITDCFEVKKDDRSDYLTETANRWAFDTKSSSFRQVQGFGNIRDISDKFLDWLESSFAIGLSLPYQSSHPSTLFSSATRPFWFRKNSSQTDSGKLVGYTDCDVADNAFFSPSKNEVCLGNLSDYPGVYFSQDPTITFHEMGHGFSQIMLNTRNLASGLAFSEDTNLGYLFYDEAGSIGEGLADFFSYAVNNRTHFAEWALGRFLNASRPLSEDDSIHAPGISTTSTERLAYPTYLSYDPNNVNSNFEDVHYAGQIISHFLVALSKDVSSYCSYSEVAASQYVLHLVMESFAELGDQTSSSFDGSAEDRINLTDGQAIDWIKLVKPINFRNFIQSLSKFHLYNLGSNLQCNGFNYPQDRLEQLVDSYGLLLFKTYNNNGSGILTGHSGTNTSVLETNRVKTVLIKKDLLKIDPREGKNQAFVIDGQQDIITAMDALKDGGVITEISTQIDEVFGFNNGNAQVSPGEVVGLALNLYNDSNSTMAGVQVLANDWDHTKNSTPCNNFDDAWPLSSEGAADLTSGEGIQGGCDYITRYNASNTLTEPLEKNAPICMVEINDTSATKWFTQDELMRRIGLDSSNCLAGSSSTKDCFIRVIKGADQAMYSKISPKSTWAETFQDPSTGNTDFNYNSVIFMEASPWIPPGTIFNCRFRARFTNCDDCWHDDTKSNDDFRDYEFSGNRPFKIINFQFKVIN